MPNDYPPNSQSRRKARSLNAQNADVLISSTISVARPYLTPNQIDQVQKVLDAAVVNPAVKKEAEELSRRAVKHRAGSLVMRDPWIERQTDKALEGLIWVSDDDKRIRLDYEKFVTKTALEPVTDNPDEAEYLLKVKNTLREKGVWLRVGQERMDDPRSFVVWFSLGSNGDPIPADLGLIDREAILGNQLLGARYFEEVTHGKTKTELEKQIDRLQIEIELGEDEHRRLVRRYDDALPGVAELSDWAGDADLPSRSIWNAPNELLSEARHARLDDRIADTVANLVLCAAATGHAAQMLADYAQKSSDGAFAVAKVLNIISVTAAVITIALEFSAAGVARMMIRGQVDDALVRLASQRVAKNAEEKLYLVRIPNYKGTISSSGAKRGHGAGVGKGFQKWP